MLDSGVANGRGAAYRNVMLTSVLTHHSGRSALDELLQAEPSAKGAEPEQRVVFCGIAWNRYLSFDKRLGDDRPGPRLYYLDGELEIMTTSNEHERVKKWIGDFMGDYFLETGIEVMPRGQATMRLALKEAALSRMNRGASARKRSFPIWCWKLP